MAQSFFAFATRAVEIMFFIGLAGCATVILISWISIFRDGFSDIQNRDADSHWEPQHHASESAKAKSATASLV